MKTKRKTFQARAAMTLLITLLLFTFIGGAKAQEKLTVCDGTATSQFIPMYGYYFDDFTKSECIMPATDLEDMISATITKITFYPSEVSTSNSTWNGTNQKVFLKEVSSTTLGGSYAGMDDAYLVFDGLLPMPTAGTPYDIELPSGGYTYNGGNLLIGVYCDDDGSYNNVKWYGISGQNSGVSAYGYNNAELSSVGYNAQTFLPKTTFTFIPAGNYSPRPANLAEANITANSATLSWEGNADSYVVQYRTAAQDMNMSAWHQVGDDFVTSHTLTQYSFDLSAYAGQTGAIAIRHYAVSDMFIVAIDDIVVTNSNNDIVVEEDFEGGSIPSAWGNLDYDGDGYLWDVYNFEDGSLQHGSYCAYSESFANYVGPLHPDNWLIIPNVELGGTLTFYAVGVDSQGYHLENLGVFVATESYAAVPAGTWSAEIPVTSTSYNLTGLTAQTPYDWRVKAIYGTEESNWAESDFTTIADGFKTFVTAGNWDVAANWFPEGVPTIDDEVTITKAVTIPANVVAQAKKATIETGGSITIEDGGQLKQGSATLKVTMQKVIPGYTQNGTDGWHFISSPFSGNTVIGTSSDWSHVLNLTSDDYDLYGFYPTAANEWINYEADSQHDVFYAGSNSNYGLIYKRGYLYANTADETVLEFNGTAVSGINNSTTTDVTFDDSSTDYFNGWRVVGNPYTCNAYVYFADASDNMLPATFYKMNAAGDDFEEVSGNVVELAPCEGALMLVASSGKIVYSSEPVSGNGGSVSVSLVPVLPQHDESVHQDANIVYDITLNDAATDNAATLSTYNNGEVANVTLSGRTLYKDSYWNTICLPFNVTLANSPLAGATAKALETASLEDGTLTLNFGNDVATLTAGTPYILRWNAPDLVINTASDWEAFANNVTNGTESYSGKIVKLGADIEISTMAGSYDYPFQGIFDGNGHKLTVTLSNDGETGTDDANYGVAPFRFTNGATIRNLTVDGTITTSTRKYAAGVIGMTKDGTNNIQNCVSSVEIYSTVNIEDNTDGTHGGFVGKAYGTLNISNCLFNGMMTTSQTDGTIKCGGFIGWNTGTIYINNSLYAPTTLPDGKYQIGDEGSATFARNGANITNCYYTEEFNDGSNFTGQGTSTNGATGSTLQALLGDQWQVSNGNVVPVIGSQVITNPTFDGVTIDNTMHNVTNGKVTFKGNYDAQNFTDENKSILFLGDANTLYYPQNGSRIGACRAFFQITDGSAVRAFNLNFGEEDTQGIISLTTDSSSKGEGSIYTINGVKYDGKPTKKGLYIKDGRKVIIK